MSGGSSTVHEIAEETKEAGPEIPIEVSFRIIKQFSLELYDNPRRAIEELVCNSYDAGATKCYISVPEDTSDDVKVLDNGESMDLEGLEWLWKVAESRKVEELGEKRIEHDRQQIGKFGVGKLASFALGDRLTHMATVDDTTRVISVHQNDLRGSRDREPFGVREYDVDEAREIFQPVIEDVPDPWEKDWDSWTLAIISDIPPENTGKDLQPWHLHRMIPSAVPSRADFTAYIEGEELETQDPPADVEFEVDLTVDEYIETLERQLRSDWAEELNVDTEDVSEDLYTVSKTTFEDPGDTSEVVAGLQVPKLGNVHGQIEFFDRKLTTGKREERDYDEHGFRVYVRGRLLNKNDISFGLENLSHRYWIRFRSEVEIPALDKELRVTRDSTQDSVELNVAKSVVRATFNTARSRADDEDLFGTTDKEEVTISLDVPFSDRLELRSPWYADQALDGLRTEDGPDFDLSDVEIEPQPLKPTEKAIEFYEEEAKFVVNSNHPLFDTLDQKTHFTQNFEDAFKEILTGRLLIHGYLRYHGAEPDALAASRQIFDAVLRSAAGSIGQDELKYQLQELHDASTEGGDRFEKAIVDIFQNIGLAAAQVGGPDEHDGWVEIPRWGQPNYRFSIEAKGSQGIVTHDDLSFDDVNRHRVEQELDHQHSIVVARAFQTEGLGEDRSALLRNADPDINEGMVTSISFWPTDAFKTFLHLHYEQPFTYSETIDVLTNDRIPAEVPRYVVDVWEAKPDEQLARRILEAAHEHMENDPTNPPEIGTITSHPKCEGVPREDIIAQLEAMSKLSASINFKEGSGIIELDGAVDTVISEVDEIEADARPILDNAGLAVLPDDSAN